MSKQEEIPRKITEVYYFPKEKIIEHCNVSNLKVLIDLLSDENIDYHLLYDTLQLMVGLADSQTFLTYLKTSNFHGKIINLIKQPFLRERFSFLYFQLIIKAFQDQDIYEYFLKTDVFSNDIITILNSTQDPQTYYWALNCLIQVTSQSSFDFGVIRHLTLKLLNDLDSPNENTTLLVILKYFVNFLASNSGQVFVESQKKNDLMVRILKIFSQTKSTDIIEEILSILWNLLQYPKESLANDRISLNQVFIKCVSEPREKKGKAILLSYQILLRSLMVSGNIPLILENYKKCVDHLIKETEEEVLAALFEFLKGVIQFAIKQQKHEYLALVLDNKVIKKLVDSSSKQHPGIALQSMRCLGILCIYTPFQKLIIDNKIYRIFLENMTDLKQTDIKYYRAILHSFEIVLIEQEGDPNVNIVYEIYESIYEFLKNIKDPHIKAEAMNVLKKLFSIKKIRIVTESAKFLAHLGNRFGRKEIEKWLEEIESYQFVKEDWKTAPEDKGSQFKKSISVLINTSRKFGLEDELKPKENYTYDNLKELKAKLDERLSEINQREKDVEEARKLITKGVLDLEKRELEMENFSVERELLRKEKEISDEEKIRLNLLCEQLKIENESLTRQIKERDEKLKECSEKQIDPRAMQELKRELEKLRMINETMKFKFNDYDRLMEDLLKANEEERRLQDEFDKVRAFAEAIEEKFLNYQTSLPKEDAGTRENIAHGSTVHDEKVRALETKIEGLAISNTHYKNTIEQLQEELNQRVVTEENNIETIEILQNQLKEARENEINLRIRAEEAGTPLKDNKGDLPKDINTKFSEKVSVDMLNQLSIKAEVLQKEMDLGKRENVYLRKHNEALTQEIERLEGIIMTLNQKISGFEEFLQSKESLNNPTATPQDFILHLQNNLTLSRKKLEDNEISLKNLEGLLKEERENKSRLERELKINIEREAGKIARLEAVEQELRSLRLLITSEEHLIAVETVRAEYEAEIIKLSEETAKLSLEMTELRYRNEYMEKKLVHCVETMMEKGVNIEWTLSPVINDEEKKLNQEDDEENSVFGRDFRATKSFLDKNVGSKDERLKVYLNKVLKRCEQLESRCNFLQDLHEQSKVLAQQPTSKSPGLSKIAEVDEKLRQECSKLNKLVKELQHANEAIKSQLVEEHRKVEAQEKELKEICKIYGKKKSRKDKASSKLEKYSQRKSRSPNKGLSSNDSSSSSSIDESPQNKHMKNKNKNSGKSLTKSIDINMIRKEKEMKKVKKENKAQEEILQRFKEKVHELLYRIKNLNFDHFNPLEEELQNLHSKKFEAISIEGALNQLEAIYLGLKNLFVQVKKIFIHQRADLFEIQIAVGDINILQEVVNSEFWSLKHNTKTQQFDSKDFKNLNQGGNEESESLKIENRILKEELLKYKVERDEKDQELQQFLNDINSLPNPLRIHKVDMSLAKEKHSEIEIIEPQKLQRLLIWSLTFSLSMNNVVVDYLENESFPLTDTKPGEQEKFSNIPSQRSRRLGLKLLKSLLEGIQKEGENYTNKGMDKIFEAAFTGFECYVNFLEESNQFDYLLTRDPIHLLSQNENISSLLNEYERIVFDKRLEDSAWGLFYKQNRLSSSLMSSVILENWYILQAFLEHSKKKDTEVNIPKKIAGNNEDFRVQRNKELSIELEEINTSFKGIVSEYSGIKVSVEELRLLEKRREGKDFKSFDDDNFNIRELKNLIEENQLLRGINNELKEQMFHIEKKNKENEAYLRQSYVCIMQFITQMSHLELIVIDLRDKGLAYVSKIEDLENQVKNAKELAAVNQGMVLPSRTDEINQKTKLQLKQLNLALILEKKELLKRINILERKFEEKKDKCKYWKSNVKELQKELDRQYNNSNLNSQIHDSYGHLLQRFISLETRYLMLIKTTKELQKNIDQSSKNSQIISSLVKIIEEFEEENKIAFYDKKSFENKFDLVHKKLKKQNSLIIRLKIKIKNQKNKLKKLKIKEKSFGKNSNEKSSVKKKDILNPTEPSKIYGDKNNDENIDEEWRKREMKNYELGIMKSSLEFIATLLIENKGGKAKDIIKDCLEYVNVLEQGIADLKKTNSNLKRENVQLQASLETQKLLRKHEKLENRSLQEDYSVSAKFKEYYKLQAEYIVSQHYLDLEFLGDSPLKSEAKEMQEAKSSSQREKDSSITSREDFYNILRKYLEKCHNSIASLKRENEQLKLQLQNSQRNNTETENTTIALKHFINELFKVSQQSQKFFKRQKQILNLYQCIIALPTLDQNTVDYFSEIQRIFIGDFLTNHSNYNPLDTNQQDQINESDSSNEESEIYQSMDENEKEYDEILGNPNLPKLNKSIINTDLLPQLEKLKEDNKLLCFKVQSKIQDLSFFKRMIKVGRFPDIFRQGEELTLESFLKLSEKVDSLENENIQLKQALERKILVEKDRNFMMKNLEEEYEAMKEDLTIFAKKKEREDILFNKLIHNLSKEEGNVVSLLINELSYLKQKLKSLELTEREMKRQNVETEIEKERCRIRLNKIEKHLKEVQKDNIKKELEIFYLKNNLDMREKFLTGFSPQKIRDSYIISLEAKMASFAAGLRELEALNEERVLKSVDLVEDIVAKQAKVYKEQITELEKQLETENNEKELLRTENKGFQNIVSKVKDEYKTFRYQNDPVHIMKKKDLEIEELKKELEVMKNIAKRLERDLSKLQGIEIDVKELRERNKKLEESLQEKEELIKKLRVINSALEDKAENGPFTKDVFSLVLKNGNISEQLKKEVENSKITLKEYESLNQDLSKTLDEKTTLITKLYGEMDNLMLKLNSLEEKEKKFYYQEMVFDQELNSKENPDLINIWTNVKKHFHNYEKQNLEEKLILFKKVHNNQDELIKANHEVALLKGNLLLQTKTIEDYKFKYEALYQGIFAIANKEELSQSNQISEIGKENEIESIEDIKSKLAKISKKLYFYEEENKIAWKRVEDYKTLLYLKEEELRLLQRLQKEDETRMQRFQYEANYLFQVNRFLGDINQLFVEYAENNKVPIPIPSEGFKDSLKGFMNQMHILSFKVLKLSETSFN